MAARVSGGTEDTQESADVAATVVPTESQETLETPPCETLATPPCETQDSHDASWPDITTGRIIELWMQRPLLYDTTHRFYLDRDKKQAALLDIANEVKISGLYIC